MLESFPFSVHVVQRTVLVFSFVVPALVHSRSKCLNGPRTFICRGCSKVIV